MEEGGIVGEEGWGGTSDGGEELGLGEAEVDAVGVTEAVKFSDVEREVDVVRAVLVSSM